LNAPNNIQTFHKQLKIALIY